MIYRPPERRSLIAGWSRALGAFALPVIVIATLGHRFGLMATDHALAAIACAFLFAAVAVLLAALALIRIWQDGASGARFAAHGLIWGVIALSPLAYLAIEWASFPRLVDVSTDPVDPPLYRAAAFARVGRVNSPTPPDADERARIRALVHDVTTRRFSVGTDLLYGVARRVIEAHDWKVTEESRPSGDGDRGRIEAVARTAVFGFTDDVVVRILAEPNGARIDLRSSTRLGPHDFGRNARRIRAFLDDLDKAVVETYGR